MFELFALFFYISITTFGGGYAMMSVLEREFVRKRKWITADELAEYIAVAQATPGVLAVNSATFIGIKRRGKLGGVMASLGVITPCVLLTCAIGGVLLKYAANPYLAKAVKGMSLAALAAVTVTVTGIVKREIKLWYITLAAFALVMLGAQSFLVAVLFLLIGVLVPLTKKQVKTNPR
jgi:chromate transporter